MTETSATLLREKFTITDVLPDDMSDKPPIIALSNRMVLPLSSRSGVIRETFVIRAQNMHTCARMAAQMARDFAETGPILNRQRTYDWKYAYLSIVKGYEKDWNPDRWVAVYHKGRVVYEDGEGTRHPFLDIIEKCEATNKGDYDQAVEIAKSAFQQAGKMVNIKHDSNVALILNVSDEEGRCGVIMRGTNRTTTFNFTARKRASRDVKISQCLSVSAAFLEGIQLCFLVGMTKKKIQYELISPESDEARQGNAASKKLGRLNAAIDQFENLLDVNYRPERPSFTEMIDSAEQFASKLLEKQVQEKIAAGELDASQWVQ